MRCRPRSSCAALLVLAACGGDGERVLVFSRTNGHRHDDAIIAGIAALPDAVPEVTFTFSEDPDKFHDLDGYRAVVFLYTSGNDVLDDAGKTEFERFVRGGGGYFGMHSASDTEYLWPFYQRVIVSHFVDDVPIQPATMQLERPWHPAVDGVAAEPWQASDEWYNFASNPRLISGVTVLATIDETTYTGGTMGDHPMIWCHENVGGRALYTALGHVAARWMEPAFVQHVASGLRWVIAK